MALVDCPNCRAGVSEAAEVCPFCGRTMPAARRRPQRRAQRPSMPVPAHALASRQWQGWQWRTRAEILGWPLVHVAFGRDAQTGRRLVARGVVAIGQFGIGLITIAQFGVGLLLGVGQFVGGFAAVGQVALGVYLGLGQFAVGLTAVGQVAIGHYVLAQAGWGQHVWSAQSRDPEAVRYFTQMWRALRPLVGP